MAAPGQAGGLTAQGRCAPSSLITAIVSTAAAQATALPAYVPPMEPAGCDAEISGLVAIAARG